MGVSKLKIRLISALIGAIFVLGMIFSKPTVFHIGVAVACFIVLHELQATFKQGKKWQLVVLQYAFAVALLLVPFIHSGIRQELTVFLLTAYLMLLLICSVIWHESVKFADALVSFFAVIYGVIFPLYLTYIRSMEWGVALVFLPFLGAWMPDTFAYFIGCRFGKHKLIPGVSPNKTIEGAAGAVFGSIVTFTLYGFILTYGFHLQVCYPALIGLSLLCSIVAQFGDLTASVIKREYNMKDFGNLIPGHGGILDRVDSLLFIAPVVYYFLMIFEVVCK
ncbi:MAG: phosphatidate cytidylyltransferase [Ruminococcaceae bacterium]|nr:phosphatidate cytidylyltransferase [Oscillospiraceae bacterium]